MRLLAAAAAAVHSNCLFIAKRESMLNISPFMRGKEKVVCVCDCECVLFSPSSIFAIVQCLSAIERKTFLFINDTIHTNENNQRFSNANKYIWMGGREEKMKRKWAKMTKNGILKRIRWYIFSTIKENKNDVIFLSLPIPILVFTSNPLQLLLLLLWCREKENLRVTKNGKNQIELMCLFPSWIHCIPSTIN